MPPIINGFTTKLYSARFCQSMTLLVSAHVPMLRAIDLVERMIGYYPYEEALRTIAAGILRGDTLSTTMARFPIFERKMVALIRVAEEVNKMDVVFNELSKQYTAELESSVSLLSSLLEPILIILVGILVGVILIAMYLPLFQLSTSFGG